MALAINIEDLLNKQKIESNRIEREKFGNRFGNNLKKFGNSAENLE